MAANPACSVKLYASMLVTVAPVVFSPELFSIQNYGGVARVMIELVRALHGCGADWTVWAGRHGCEQLPQIAAELGAEERVIGDFEGKLPGRLVSASENEWKFRQYLRSRGRAVVHRTQYPVIDMIPSGFPKVVTLHDMWTERPDVRALGAFRSGFKRRAMEGSDAIVCVSDNTFNDLREHWPKLAGKAVVIKHGVRSISAYPVPAPYDHPYFLYVGAREERKNFAILIEAFRACDRFGDVKLVCVGGGAFNEAEQALIAGANLAGAIVQRRANDDELAGLYESAVALLYPSRFEGFGMPLLEAMLHGCPVVSSPLTCLPEIGGAAALYCDADDPQDWAAAMMRLIDDEGARAQCVVLGRQRAAEFTWDDAAAKYLKLYAGVV